MSRTRGHIPERTCIACRQKRPKRELVRVVRNFEGDVEVDFSAKKAGRGAYLCRNKKCWEFAIDKDKKNRLARALRARITPESRAILREYIESFPVDNREGVK